VITTLIISKKQVNISLFLINEHIVHDVDFSNNIPWSECADGYGYTLVAKPESYIAIAANSTKYKDKHAYLYWRYSSLTKGSPFADDPIPQPPRVISLEFSFVSIDGNWIEIYNPSASDINITGWIIKQTNDDNFFTVPRGIVASSKKFTKIMGINIQFDNEAKVRLYKTITLNSKFINTGEFVEFDLEENELSVEKRRRILNENI